MSLHCKILCQQSRQGIDSLFLERHLQPETEHSICHLHKQNRYNSYLEQFF